MILGQPKQELNIHALKTRLLLLLLFLSKVSIERDKAKGFLFGRSWPGFILIIH